MILKYPPQEAKYKVYIMDEVHMLSAGAVNAFLKTLEEPPKCNIYFGNYRSSKASYNYFI